MISKQTAEEIWIAYDEISKGEALLVEMEKELEKGPPQTPRDRWGRRCLQLGIPSGESGHRLLDVQPKLGIAVIKAHIAEKRAMLEVLNEKASKEI